MVSIKRYSGWAADGELVGRDPARAVKQVPRVVPPPSHRPDRGEAALVAAVKRYGSLRDRTLMMAFHTGFRSEELYNLKS